MSDEFGFDRATKSGPFVALHFRPAAGLWLSLAGSLLVLVASQAAIYVLFASTFAPDGPPPAKKEELAPGPWLDSHEDLQLRYDEIEVRVDDGD